jgi:hypothetical protein
LLDLLIVECGSRQEFLCMHPYFFMSVLIFISYRMRVHIYDHRKMFSHQFISQ